MRGLELSACPACGSDALDTFELGGHSLHRCCACQLVSAPDYADPADVYVDGYMFGGAGQFGLAFDVRHPSFQRYLQRVALRRIAMIERASGIRDGHLLDVGCGPGEV